MSDRRSAQPVKPSLAIHLLGAFFVSVDQHTLSEAQWRSRRASGLVKLLALTPGHRLHREQLIDALWPASTPEAGYNNFHHTLFTARRVLDKALPGCLVLEEGFLSLTKDEAQAVSVDAEDFEAAARRAKESPSPEAFQTALALYTGDLLPDDRYEAWTMQPREALRQTYLRLLLGLAKLQETYGDYQDGIATLLRLLAVDHSHEEGHRELMAIYALSGNRQQALRQYQTLREVLRTELEVEPSPATLQLYETIQSGQISTSTATPPAPGADAGLPKPERWPRHNLPNRLSTFIGREKEIDQVLGLLRGTRLLTVTGAGGVGKTSLALQAVGYLLETYPEGIWLVELAPLANPELVPQTCAHVLELNKPPDTPYLTALIQYLQKKHLLLILDNCEHLVAACADLTAELLKNCPRLTILATSREVLNLSGECAYRVPSLSVPDPHLAASLDAVGSAESVRLFVARATQISPAFSLTRENAPAIATICRRLDGIPLAIELAAGRSRLLAVDQIAARLDQAFNLLTGGTREALPRQQTLKATIEWSYQLLTPKEQVLLQRLSVFAGGWTLEAAEAICPKEPDLLDKTESHEKPTGASSEELRRSEIVDLLGLLLDKSLVQTIPSSDGLNRYCMLETIRQFAFDRLLEAGGIERLRDRHLAYFAELTGEAEPHLRGKGMVEWMDRLEEELDNLGAAMQWSLTGRIDLGLKIAADLHWFWWIRNFTAEGREWIKKLLSKEKVDAEILADNKTEYNHNLQKARALITYTTIHFYSYIFPYDERIGLCEESVAILRKLGPTVRRELAVSLFWLLAARGSLPKPSPEREEMLEIFQQEGMRFQYSEYLRHVAGQILHSEWGQGKKCIEESLAISREIDDLEGIATGFGNLAYIFNCEGDYQKAEILAREFIEVSHREKNRLWERGGHMALIDIELASGKYQLPVEHSEGAKSISLDDTQLRWSIVSHNTLQALAWARGDYVESIRQGNEILHAYEGIARDEKALTYYYLTRVALSQNNLDQAVKIISETWGGDLMMKARILQGAGVLLTRQEKYRPAVRSFGAADEWFKKFWLGLPMIEREEYQQAFEASRSALGEDVFAVAWKEGKAMSLDEARDFALKEIV